MAAADNYCYRELILNSSVPIVFRDCLDWDMLTWNLEDWSKVFENRLLPFRVADRKCRKVKIH